MAQMGTAACCQQRSGYKETKVTGHSHRQQGKRKKGGLPKKGIKKRFGKDRRRSRKKKKHLRKKSGIKE